MIKHTIFITSRDNRTIFPDDLVSVTIQHRAYIRSLAE